MPPRRPGGVRVRSPSPPSADTDRRLNPYRDSALRRRSRSPDAARPYRAAVSAVRRRSRSPERRDYSGRFADEQYRRRYVSDGLPQDSYAYREAAIAKEPSGLGDRGVLLQRSLNLEGGGFRTFYSLPSESGRLKGDSAMAESGKYGGVYTSAVSVAHGGVSSDRLYPSKVAARKPFDGGRSSYNFKGFSYTTIPSSSDPTKSGFGSLSSVLPKDGFVGSSASGTCDASVSKKYKSLLDSDGYARLPAYDYGNGYSLKDSHRYDGVSRNPVRDVSHRDGTYLELSKRISTTSGFEPNVLDQRLNTTESHYRRMPAGSDLLSSMGVRSSGLRSENLGKPYGSLRESTLGTYGAPRGDYDNNECHERERPPFVKKEAGFSKYMESGSSVSDFRSRISRADDISYYGGGDCSARHEASMTDYGGRVNNPSEVGYHTRLYENRGDQPSSLHEFRVHDSYDSRILRGHSPDEIGRHDRRFPLPLRPGAFKASEELDNEDDEWDNHDLTEILPEKRTIFARNDRLQRVSFLHSPSVSDDEWVPDEGSLHEYFAYDAQDIRKKKRIFKPGQLNFSRKPAFDRKKDFHKPGKYHKVAMEERLNMGNKADEDPEEDQVPVAVKREPVDPLEGTDEFKQLVHKAFLRFSKQLNEEAAQQRKYMEQGKVGALLCCVCGRDSKEFGDMHSLIAHTFNSSKGLRSDHLGLHKALCVMMGWDSLIPPDMGKKYQVMVAAEAADLKEDLIIWPAVVILHNSSIGIKNSNAQEVVTNEMMKNLLGEMGFGGKAKVCRGKPANHSILLVKFMPTFSGLQEAERLHKYLDEKKRGRKEWLQISIGSKLIDTKVIGEDVEGRGKVEQLFYGYLAIAEDLIKLDFESKRRSVVKSKREIVAIVGASMNGERLTKDVLVG